MFITGTASGNGRATTVQSVADGFCPIELMDISESLRKTATLISNKNSGATIVTITADVSTKTDGERGIAETASASERIDYSVDSTRTGGLLGPTTNQKDEALDKTSSINLQGM